MTVEIGYAVVSAVLVAGATFAGILGPAVLFDLTRVGDDLLFRIAKWTACAVFAARVVHVLWRFPRSPEGRRLPPAQPSQPGRTSPDS